MQDTIWTDECQMSERPHLYKIQVSLFSFFPDNLSMSRLLKPCFGVVFVSRPTVFTSAIIVCGPSLYGSVARTLISCEFRGSDLALILPFATMISLMCRGVHVFGNADFGTSIRFVHARERIVGLDGHIYQTDYESCCARVLSHSLSTTSFEPYLTPTVAKSKWDFETLCADGRLVARAGVRCRWDICPAASRRSPRPFPHVGRFWGLPLKTKG